MEAIWTFENDKKGSIGGGVAHAKQVANLRHVALLQDVGRLLDVADDPFDDDVRMVDLNRVHDGLEDVDGELKLI